MAPPVTAMIHSPLALEADPSKADSPIAPLLEGLGDHHFPVTTQIPQSQVFFDQGLRLTYAFNHSEALRAFKEAARLDPDNAMAYWGWALVLGPNLNLPMVPDVRRPMLPSNRRWLLKIRFPSGNAPTLKPSANGIQTTLLRIASHWILLTPKP